MDFKKLPYDVQNCTFSVSLYSLDVYQATLQWISSDSSIAVPDWRDSVTLEEWKIRAVLPYVENSERFEGRDWSYARATITVERNSQYYEQYVIFGTIMFAMLACVPVNQTGVFPGTDHQSLASRTTRRAHSRQDPFPLAQVVHVLYRTSGCAGTRCVERCAYAFPEARGGEVGEEGGDTRVT